MASGNGLEALGQNVTDDIFQPLYRSKSNFVSHLITHHQERSTCSHCDVMFYSEKEKFVHMGLVHPGVRQKCPGCNIFICSEDFRLHEITMQLERHWNNCCHERVSKLFVLFDSF